jgi:hypothetical protein
MMTLTQGGHRLRPRVTLALTAAATALLLCAGTAAEPVAAATSSGGERSTSSFGRTGKVATEFRFTFDRRESLRPGTIVRDVSGHRHHGTVKTSNAGHLRKVNGNPGKAAKFPCIGCGRALINVRDQRRLDPGRNPFWFGASVKVADRQARRGKDPNIMQKGLISQPGSRWKLELIGSRPQCTIRGSAGQLVVRATQHGDNATWHQLQCRRHNGVVSLWIDGTVAAQKTGRTGRVANNAPVRIGAKALASGGGDDQYHGRLDSLFYKIDRG